MIMMHGHGHFLCREYCLCIPLKRTALNLIGLLLLLKQKSLHSNNSNDHKVFLLLLISRSKLFTKCRRACVIWWRECWIWGNTFPLAQTSYSVTQILGCWCWHTPITYPNINAKVFRQKQKQCWKQAQKNPTVTDIVLLYKCHALALAQWHHTILHRLFHGVCIFQFWSLSNLCHFFLNKISSSAVMVI